MKVITLSRMAMCKSCGATIPAGAKARYYSADAIYCESHQKDAQGRDIPNADLVPQLPALKPFVAPASEPQPVLSLAEISRDFICDLRELGQAIHWQTEKVSLATDFLNTLCILMRQNQEARNAQTVNSQGKPAKASVQKKA